VDGIPPITALQAKVTVRSALAQNCAANPEATRSRANLFGFFFNDGSSTGPTDFTGDIIAGITVERNSKTGDRIVAFLNRCDTAACVFSTNLVAAVFTRTWTLGIAQLLTVVWQPANNRFVYTVSGGGLATETRILTYTQPDAALPRLFLKELRVANTVPNCTAGRRVAAIDALFDSVAINANAVPAAALSAEGAEEAEGQDPDGG